MDSGPPASGTRSSQVAALDTRALSTSELPVRQPHLQGPAPPRGRPCRYFASKSGCRSGAACRFKHETHDTAPASSTHATASVHPQERSQPLVPAAGKSPAVQSDNAAERPHAGSNTPRITQRPTPASQLTDPRQYQLTQVRRRFAPSEQQNDDGSTGLTFLLRPSDPDFPFEMDFLRCALRIPSDYPKGGKPSLRVTNPEMERGYQINVERGFDRIVTDSGQPNLLKCLNTLDRQLESLLSSQKADTIKLIAHGIKAEASKGRPGVRKVAEPEALAARAIEPEVAVVAFTAEQRSRARALREAETNQLNARLGRLPQFSKSADGLTYIVPIEPRKRMELPTEIQAVKQIKLLVPEDYNLVQPELTLVGVEGAAAKAVESAFAMRVHDHPEMSLFNHINYLSQNMHIMAIHKPVVKDKQPEQHLRETTAEQGRQSPTYDNSTAKTAGLPADLADRSHVITIPRPPEWNVDEGSDDHTNTSSEDSDDTDEDDIDDSIGAQDTDTANATQERGISLSFPHIELYGIELLEIGNLNITVKCERCKDIKDITNLRNASQGAHDRTDTCNKCAQPFALGFRAELIHANAIRAGFLDLDGCTIVDMLPSSFLLTCAGCSTTIPKPGVTSVRGETSTAFCRECHSKMTLQLPEIKFLRISASTVHASQAPRRKKQAEKLGIVAGQELPNRGRCTHYKKSYRWFRFSCCNKVFACDRCHDEAAEHAIEHANRMLCGFCSREQNYRPKDCGICHAFLTVRPGKGFWEGGQGTRDRTKMSRKDPRKYKRVKGGSKPAS